MGLAWGIGVALRLFWHIRVGAEVPDFFAHGAPILTSNDGWYWALGVDVARGGPALGLTHVPAAGETALVALGWLLSAVAPWSPDAVMYYLPAVIGPLVVVPTALLARDLLGARAALVAAFAVVAAPRLAARTGAGYYDSDMFAVAVPLLACWLFVRMAQGNAIGDAVRARRRAGLLAALTLAALPFFYDQAGPVGLATALCGALVLVLFHRRDAAFAPTLAALGLSQLPLPWPLTMAVVALAWLGLTRAPLRPRAQVALAIALALVGLVSCEAWLSGLMKLIAFTGGAVPTDGPSFGEQVDLGRTTRFVAEAQSRGLADFATGVAGSLPALVVGALGMAVLALRHRALLVMAPLGGLALFALRGGGRFQIFGAPLAALGLAAVAAIAVARLRPPLARALAGVALAALAVVPAALEAATRPANPPLLAGEIAALDALGQLARPGDLTIAWWDYGYPIAYYARTAVLADGGVRGDDAALVADVLTSPSQRGAAVLARVAAEAEARVGQGGVAAALFEDGRQRFGLSPLATLGAMATPMYPSPPATRDVYLYLPTRMATVLAAVALSRPRAPGATPPTPSVRIALDARALPDPARVVLTDGTVIDPLTLGVRAPGGDRALGTLYVVTGAGRDRDVQIRRSPRPAPGAPTGIFDQGSGTYYELDEALASSLYVRLALLDAADPTLFELVFASADARIYRLREPVAGGPRAAP